MSGERTCSHCGTSMQESQDWCLHCGAGAPGAFRKGPGWRSAAIVLGATGVLVLGAAAAAYAALQEGSPAKPPVLAQTPTTTTTTTTAPATSPPSTTPAPTPAPGQGNRAIVPSPSLRTRSTPPQIPGVTLTPSGGRKSKASTGTKSSSTTSTTTTSSSSSEAEQKSASQPVAVLLDTNAAQIYNPGNLPASRFGDPSLAIDGDTTTAWTVQLEGSEAPSVGAGLTLNLNSPLKIAQLTLITETTGITVQIYGTNSAKVPPSLHSEEWVRLSHAHLVKKRKATITLEEGKKSFRQLLLWIVKAPTSSSGQFTASDVAINEIQLYEPDGSGA